MQIRAETLVLEGDAKDMICQAVEQMHVDLLVVGSRGLGKIKRYITILFPIFYLPNLKNYDLCFNLFAFCAFWKSVSWER